MGKSNCENHYYKENRKAWQVARLHTLKSVSWMIDLVAWFLCSPNLNTLSCMFLHFLIPSEIATCHTCVKYDIINNHGLGFTCMVYRYIHFADYVRLLNLMWHNDEYKILYIICNLPQSLCHDVLYCLKLYHKRKACKVKKCSQYNWDHIYHRTCLQFKIQS